MTKDAIKSWLIENYGDQVSAAGSLRKILADMNLSHVSLKTIKIARDEWEDEVLAKQMSNTQAELESFNLRQDELSQALWQIIRPIIEEAKNRQNSTNQQQIDDARLETQAAIDSESKLLVNVENLQLQLNKLQSQYQSLEQDYKALEEKHNKTLGALEALKGELTNKDQRINDLTMMNAKLEMRLISEDEKI